MAPLPLFMMGILLKFHLPADPIATTRVSCDRPTAIAFLSGDSTIRREQPGAQAGSGHVWACSGRHPRCVGRL